MKCFIAVVLSLLLLQACDTNNQEVSDRQAEVTDFESTKARAEAGDVVAQYNLGYIYANGMGVTFSVKGVPS